MHEKNPSKVSPWIEIKKNKKERKKKKKLFNANTPLLSHAQTMIR